MLSWVLYNGNCGGIRGEIASFFYKYGWYAPDEAHQHGFTRQDCNQKRTERMGEEHLLSSARQVDNRQQIAEITTSCNCNMLPSAPNRFIYSHKRLQHAIHNPRQSWNTNTTLRLTWFNSNRIKISTNYFTTITWWWCITNKRYFFNFQSL